MQNTNIPDFLIPANIVEAATNLISELPAGKVGGVHLALQQLIKNNVARLQEKAKAAQPANSKKPAGVPVAKDTKKPHPFRTEK